MSNRQMGVILVVCVLVSAATAAAGQHLWTPANAQRAGVLRPSVVRARSVTGPAAGLYCSDLTQNGAGVHDLGWIPAGFRVDVDVESYSPPNSDFDPVASVIVTTMGVAGGNAAKVTTFYDNDSGGGRSPRVSFVTPQGGTYVLLVSDQSGQAVGCYRYQANIQ